MNKVPEIIRGSDVRVKINLVGSQDTTGLMTCQELEAMALVGFEVPLKYPLAGDCIGTEQIIIKGGTKQSFFTFIPLM